MSLLRHLVAWLGLALTWPAMAESRVAIIIDDLGNDVVNGEWAVTMPGALTLSFLPDTPHARRLAEQGHRAGKEIMLHMPMQSRYGRDLGPGGLTLEQSTEQFQDTAIANLEAVPHLAGVNNHMGSRLTCDADAMDRFMQALRQQQRLYFVDSRTHVESVAQDLAEAHGIRNSRRDVFLDNIRDPNIIRTQIQRLMDIAEQRGTAIAIGHPHAETLGVLEAMIPEIEARGISLVPVSELIVQQRRVKSWHVSSSPLLPDVKKSRLSPSSTCCDAPVSR